MVLIFNKGETWNTFYYHHVKHHHIEDNGIEDLSATIWYDRDNWLHFAAYFFRFYFFIALELPIYFIKKGKLEWALKTFVGEVSTLVFYSSFFYVCDPRSVIFAWFVPLNMARIGMMSGNWTQHAFLDPDHATNDYKTALTVIDTYYNKTCFNDGYHTSHHLNPIRHWQDHPEHFLASREKFNEQKVIIFRNCDYWEIWCHLMVKDHVWLAKHLVSNDSDSVEAKVAFLKTRLKRLSPQQMKNSFAKKSL